MKRRPRYDLWLSLVILATLPGIGVAQPAPGKPADQPKQLDILAIKPYPDDPQDDELRKLLKARYNEALAVLQRNDEDIRAGRAVLFVSLFDANQRLVQAGLDLCDGPDEKIALYARQVEIAKQYERCAQSQKEVGVADAIAVHRARYNRLDAEIQLLRAKREADKSKAK